ncbi:NAD(P)/FAD-dependent oxidoreductase [Leptospira brenneri]|uniref:NAD(P)/FAD-dependent oxidoreductase n=1 Tax=Leptospira brenneri TaxID=2023182 RepID=A0A2M9Y263_9LEPT|nr:NAD(P)/FAD-dependent oxidoreductase [Leptospira brenneri]PJZ45486.1 FAD-dependent oxidoreductase [Leptospira brenneri]TGK91979.1 NAD(P)/FAD-dependent oxidoreductase [Leptospira brenneri]
MGFTKRIVIIGAGPAGLTSGYLLAKKGFNVTILEADAKYVGGISRTESIKGFYFDIGGHRFFSKSKEVEDFWTEILPNDMLDRPRSSRIYYNNKFYAYPLKAFEALFNLGIFESILCVLSYLKASIFPVNDPKNFEDWVTNQFGKRLFSIFFKTYTEKVWGMDTKDISADWAAQRIKGLSLYSAIWNAIKPKSKVKDKSKMIKTLIDSFRYPRKGPGMMWEACASKIQEMGGEIKMGNLVTQLELDGQSWKIHSQNKTGKTEVFEAEHVISSAPIRELFHAIKKPMVSPQALSSANSLRYRDFLTVALVVTEKDIFDDNWIYIHDPSVKVGRIQNFKSWSPEMVPDPAYNCYGLEYFCFEGDGLWSSTDEELVNLAKKEVVKLGLTKLEDIKEGFVVRQKKAYPVYDDVYQDHIDVLKAEIQGKFHNLHLVGRNGMHKYNNQDHAMMTAMLTVENIVADRTVFDVWNVNQDAEYHESGEIGRENIEERLVPLKV